MDGASGRSRLRLTAGVSAFLVAATALVAIAISAPQAQALTIPVNCGDVTGLRNAITSANGTAVADVIEIQDVDPCVFNIPNTGVTANAALGDYGLPIIVNPLTIEGHGATFQRSGNALYRILGNFGATGSTTLRDLTIVNGRLGAVPAAPAGASRTGAGILAFSPMTLARTRVTNNVATGANSTGGIAALGALTLVDNSMVSSNSGLVAGGIGTLNVPVTLDGSTSTSNTASAANSGAGINVVGGALTITGGGVTSNTSTGATSAGGIRTDAAAVALDGVNLTANAATVGVNGIGGASIANPTAPVAIDDSTFAFNSGSNTGVLAIANATSEVRGSLFFRNAGVVGAAAFAGGTATFRNNTVSGNIGSGGAGGLLAINSGTTATQLDVDHTTFADNGSGAAPGAAVSTWSVNFGGGIAPAVADISNSIITDTDSTAPNTVDSCLRIGGTGTINDLGGNLEWPNDTCGFETVADPLLGAFAANGGPTLNYMPQPGSPAIDLGVAPCPSVDQRGVARPDGDACDSGSIETPAPETTAEGPVGATDDNTPEITFESPDDEDATFECRVDEGAFAACASPFTPTLTDGLHTVEVRAVNAGGYADPSPASVTFTVDTVPPIVNIEPVETPTTDSTPTIVFTIEDETATTTQCQIDEGTPVDCTSPWDVAPPLGDGTYTITVIATDAAGNTGEDSVEITIDNAPPVVTIDPPTSPTNDSTPSITFTVNEPATIECQIDDGDFVPCSSPFEAPDPLDDGVHTFTVRATDATLNVGSDSVDIEVDTTGPVTTIDDPTTPTTDSTPEITFSADDDGATFECSVDTGPFVECETPFTTPPLNDGAHTIAVHGIDQLGNVGPADEVEIVVDAVAPDTAITSGPSNTTIYTDSATYTFVSIPPGSTFQCSFDSAAFEPCTSPKTYSGFAPGTHTFAVRAHDVLTFDETPATATFLYRRCTIRIAIGGVTILCL